MGPGGLILVVCTGNVCRSPYIERLLGDALAAYDVEVGSAGTHALEGAPMDDGSARLLGDVGVRSDGFVARQLTSRMAQGAGLILTATRAHRSSVVRMTPKVLRHTYALADFCDLVAGAEIGSHASGFVGLPLTARLAAAAASRRGEVPVRAAGEADIVDPYRKPPEVFDQMAAEVAQLLPPIIRATRRLAG